MDGDDPDIPKLNEQTKANQEGADLKMKNKDSSYLLNDHQLPHDNNSIFSGPGHQSIDKQKAYLASIADSVLKIGSPIKENIEENRKESDQLTSEEPLDQEKIDAFLRDNDIADIIN